jgi:hypothetical protein
LGVSAIRDEVDPQSKMESDATVKTPGR